MAEAQLSNSASKGDPSTQRESSPASLLVIDDDGSICAVIEKLGEKAGFTPRRAMSAEEATKLLRAQRFDCITLDLGIGKNSGIELLSVLAEMKSTTPIIIISGSMRSMRDFAVTIASNMHLAVPHQFAKPIDFAKLKEALVEVKETVNVQGELISAA